jgi:Tfp pilus assembly protein PilN
LSKQNRQVEFLNSQIAKRTFSWSRLIDRLAEVLPNTVQLRRVTPVVNDPDDARRARRDFDGQQTVSVELVGVTSSNEAILEFVDALFEHPSFVSPDLSSESRRQEGLDQFSLRVIYLPEAGLETDRGFEEVPGLEEDRGLEEGP